MSDIEKGQETVKFPITPEQTMANALAEQTHLPERREVTPSAEEESRLAKTRAQIKQVGKHVLSEHISTTRENAQTQQKRKQDPRIKAARYAAETLLESIPGQFGPWGIGDVVTALEAIIGRTFLDGKKLSLLERGIYLGASVIPVLPARPVVTVYEYLHDKFVTPVITQPTTKE